MTCGNNEAFVRHEDGQVWIRKRCKMFMIFGLIIAYGRNGRNMVNIGKRKFLEVYGREMNHKDVNLECHTTKRGQTVFSANRRVATCTVRAMKAKLESENCKISYSCVLFLKPFFITYPTDKELALCLCQLCLNTRLLLETLVAQGKKGGDSVPESVTEFFYKFSSMWKNI